MTTRRVPPGLRSGGLLLWRQVNRDHKLDAVQAVQLLEACRAKDRLDQLDLILRGDADAWARVVVGEDRELELRIDDVLVKANATANQMKQLLAALRLPDSSDVRPQRRGGAWGSYVPPVKDGKVSSLDRAREAKSKSGA